MLLLFILMLMVFVGFFLNLTWLEWMRLGKGVPLIVTVLCAIINTLMVFTFFIKGV